MIIFAPEGGPTEYAGFRIISMAGYRFPFYPEFKLIPPTFDFTPHLKAFRPDVVHVMCPAVVGVEGIRQSRKLGIPVVASYHTDIPGYMRIWGLKFLSAPSRNYLRWVHNQADLNFCPSTEVQKELVTHGFKQMKIWDHGVDAHNFHPCHQDEDCRHQLTDGNCDAPLLLSVGRISSEKRIELLKPVLETFPHLRLAIVGDGPYRTRLEQIFAGTKTVFTGYLHGKDLAQAYASADLFVFPAPKETFGNVAMEAMASGLPVIATQSGGPVDFVQVGKTGLLFPPNDQQALIDAVDWFLADWPRRPRQLGAAGRQFAETYTWSKAMAQLVSEYKTLAHQMPQPFNLPQNTFQRPFNQVHQISS